MDMRTVIYVGYTLVATVYAYNKDILTMYVRKYGGEGTYYDRGTFGTCDYGPILPSAATHHRIHFLVGLGPKQFNNGLGCGMCFKVRAKGKGLGKDPIIGDFVVFVNDLCTDCEEGDMDFAGDLDGRWEIESQAVQCPVGQTKIEYKFQGSNDWYIKLQIRNARMPVTQVHVLRWGEKEEMKHTPDGFWELANGKFSLPIHIQMTSINGETVIDIIPEIENDIIIRGVNFAQFQYDPRLIQA